ncbi:hypothetical protein AFM18_24705 [Achromobacter spanius]|uniref:Uncharacterized protein n=1 Tax=Achromobacter spanius TaxID=217203 RepID=A0AAW3HX56_9BURK|nr:hypothetical protein AFM18_24705 [Achromobacter spanius]
MLGQQILIFTKRQFDFHAQKLDAFAQQQGGLMYGGGYGYKLLLHPRFHRQHRVGHRALQLANGFLDGAA